MSPSHAWLYLVALVVSQQHGNPLETKQSYSRVGGGAYAWNAATL